MKSVYFDESGQTGVNLFDRDQPFFTIGSTDIEPGEAAEIIAACFPRHTGDELKSKRLFKQPSNQPGLIAFAREIGKRPNSFCGSQIDKRFAIVGKMVDNIVEPLLHSRGYDFYADGYARRFANTMTAVFADIADQASVDALLEAYNVFARKPAAETLKQLQAAFDGLRGIPEKARDYIRLMETGAKHFDELNDLPSFKDTNDIHVTAVLQCVDFWQDRIAEPFDIVHDESIHFFEREDRWLRMIDRTITPSEIVFGAKTLKLPLPVRSVSSERSHDCASLQLCDLVAGFLSRASNRNPDLQRFFREAFHAGLCELTVFPLGPDKDFVTGPPRSSTGPDALDRMIEAMQKR